MRIMACGKLPFIFAESQEYWKKMMPAVAGAPFTYACLKPAMGLKQDEEVDPVINEQLSSNRAFQEMRKSALQRLTQKDPEEIMQKTGITLDRSQDKFSLSSLGQSIQIRYPEFEITPALDEWHHLIILHYMDMADGSALSGQLMNFGDLPGGLARGAGFDRQSERDLSLRMGNRSWKDVEQACRALGGILVDSNADISAVFSLFPRYPITLKLWFADEEIPGSGRLLLDRSASHYLSMEDAVTAGSLLLEALFRKLDSLCLNGVQ